MAMYIDKTEFTAKIKESQKLGYITESLAKDFILMADRLLTSSKFYNYNYELKQEMKSYGLLRIIKYFNKFDINRCQNPFNYFTRILDSSFLNEYSKFNRYNIKKEKIKNDFILKMKEEFPGKVFKNHDFREEEE